MSLGVRRLAFALIGAVAVTPAVAGSPDPTQVLALLHDGRFEAARALLNAEGPPRRTEDLFLDAFTTYWRLVFDDENDALRGTLERQLNATILSAESLKAPDDAGDAALWAGSGHLLLAELRASQRRSMAAAFEAKKAKRLLESAAIEGAGATDARFGLGTYNYLAATVPSYVKGLRALLFLPPGNRELGLQQLQGAAAGSRYFAFEARGLLITIYANKRERQYTRAMAERKSLLAAYPDTIASSYASARLDLSLGRNESALAELARAEQRAQKLGDVDAVVVRCVDLLRARAELAAFRPDLAEATASRALASGKGLSPAIARDLEGLRGIARNLAKDVSWPQAGADFAELARAHPDRPILAVLAGYSGLRAGRAQEALDWFTRASSAGLAIEWQAGCDFRKGQAEDLLGARTEAVAIYKRVSETKGFVARDGAYYHLQTPFGLAR